MEKAIEYRSLYAAALETAARAYAPYSKFRVGAALLLEDGTIVTGVNVENRSFGLTNCAERSAIYAAVSSGVRKFTAIAVATPDSDYPVSPCGACRQVLSELLNEDTPIVLSNGIDVQITNIKELLPFSFSKDDLVK